MNKDDFFVLGIVLPFIFLSFAFFWWFPPIFALCVYLAFYIACEWTESK
jgi:hypothetical protein